MVAAPGAEELPAAALPVAGQDALHADARRVLAAWPAPDADQERLRQDYLAHLDRHPDGVWRTCRPGHLTASALVVDPVAARVLLTLHRRVGRWLQLGGHCEPGDVSVLKAAAREAREESGIQELALLPVPVRLDRHQVPCGGSRAEHLDVQYVALAPTGALERVSAESLELRWFGFDELPQQDRSVLELAARARTLLAGGPIPGEAAAAAASRAQASASSESPRLPAADTPSR